MRGDMLLELGLEHALDFVVFTTQQPSATCEESDLRAAGGEERGHFAAGEASLAAHQFDTRTIHPGLIAAVHLADVSIQAMRMFFISIDFKRDPRAGSGLLLEWLDR